jgi:hypothetical protein
MCLQVHAVCTPAHRAQQEPLCCEVSCAVPANAVLGCIAQHPQVLVVAVRVHRDAANVHSAALPLVQAVPRLGREAQASADATVAGLVSQSLHSATFRHTATAPVHNGPGSTTLMGDDLLQQDGACEDAASTREPSIFLNKHALSLGFVPFTQYRMVPHLKTSAVFVHDSDEFALVIRQH